MRNRPIALGVQGLADAFMALRLPFDSQEARELNIQIFETIYHGAVESSIELATKFGPYPTYEGSPASKGLLQYDLWDRKPTELWNWDDLKQKLAKHGMRNSLLVAPMPTASTSQILGNNECFEPYTSNIYSRRVLAGEFQIVNPFLLKDLVDMGLWNESMKNNIIANNGSIQNLTNVPAELKALYKTVWEISQKHIIDMAADRAAFIDQSQSLNIHIKDPTMGKLTSMHFYGWKKGLKTGMYYLRTQAAAAAIQFTIDKNSAQNANNTVGSLEKLNRRKYLPRSIANSETDSVSTRSGSTEPTSLENSIGELKIEEKPQTPNTTQNEEQVTEKKDENTEESENDIYSSKVIACSIANPDSCTMCSG